MVALLRLQSLRVTTNHLFLDLNMHLRYEAVATDTVYCDTPTIDDRSNSVQLFVGKGTLLTDVYGMKFDK